MRSILKYPGSKWSIVDWIISHFPSHHSYLEPFFGSGAVLFCKERSNIETINDLDDNVINLFDCIRRDPERLAQEIYLTPYSRKIYDDTYRASILPKNNFEKARIFFIKCNMGHGFRTNGTKVGWKNDVQGRERAYAARDWASLPERIIKTADRLRGVQIDNQPAQKIIQRFNSSKVLIYADPPYMLETRYGKQYNHEMTRQEHIELLEILLAHSGPVIISGYETELYNNMLDGWYKAYTTAYSQTASKKKEVIWMNFEQPQQISLIENLGNF